MAKRSPKTRKSLHVHVSQRWLSHIAIGQRSLLTRVSLNLDRCCNPNITILNLHRWCHTWVLRVTVCSPSRLELFDLVNMCINKHVSDSVWHFWKAEICKFLSACKLSTHHNICKLWSEIKHFYQHRWLLTDDFAFWTTTFLDAYSVSLRGI